MNGMQGNTQRFGIGLASLAEKRCPGYRMGPAVGQTFEALGAVTPEQQSDLMALAEQDALAFLKAQGKELCDAAADIAQPGALIERVEQ